MRTNRERAYVISDLHLGAGPDDALEDFVADHYLCDFVDSMAATGTTLIINGDFVDFAQIEPLDPLVLPSGLLWDEPTSVLKLESAMQGHPLCFAALARFLTAGGALRVVIGNHDLDFAWPQVQRRLRQAVGDERGAIDFVVGATNCFGVHIEHGYQFTPENCPRDPNQFVLEHDGVERLERVWGTDFLLRYFNDLERRHRFIDNVKPTASVVWHGLRDGWLPRSEILRLAAFLKRAKVPFGAVAGAVLSADDVNQILVDSFVDPEWRQLAIEAIAADPAAMEATFEALTVEERAVVISRHEVRIEQEDLVTSTDSTLGLFRHGSREARAARARLRLPGVTHVVFGHTHRVVVDGLEGHHLNPGSWIPSLNLRSPHVAEKLRTGGLTLALLGDPNMFEVDLHAVAIAPGPVAAKVEVISCM